MRGKIFDLDEANKWMSIYTTVVNVGAAIGAMGGGVIVSKNLFLTNCINF